MSVGCPSCGAISGYGPDEDGYDYCLKCGGPTYCEKCGLPVTEDALDGPDGYSCEGCGAMLHHGCFPDRGSDTILCARCIEDAPGEAA